MSGAPSQAPSFPPTSQPVAEAPHDIPGPGIASPAKVGISLLAVLFCAALAVILYRRYHSRTPHQVSKSETGDTENPSAKPNEDSRHADAEEGAAEDGSQDDEDKAVAFQHKRAQKFFPSLDLAPDVVRNSYSGKYGGLKGYIFDYVQRTLQEMDQGKREHLMKRENAEKLCKELGIDEDIVRIKFYATRKIEKMMGFQFKTPILDSIYHLIKDLDYDNPFGTVNDGIECYQGREDLSYMGVRINPKDFIEKISFVEKTLIENGFGDCFMHGTTATTLKQVDDNGLLTSSNSKHDFGPGLYCFKGELRRALSYAFDRSWPDPGSGAKKKKMSIANISKDNPSVVVFSDAVAPEIETFHVGYTDYPYSDEELRTMLGSRIHASFRRKQQNWDQSNSREVKWKEFVKLARCHNYQPENFRIFHGWLHDSDCLEGTDNCNEPVIESDRWEQYCFLKPDGRYLGEKRLYIELHLNWAEWVSRDSTPKQLTEEKDKIVGRVTREHQRQGV